MTTVHDRALSICSPLNRHVHPSSNTSQHLADRLKSILRSIRSTICPLTAVAQEYGHQMQYIGDTKAGTLIGIDRYGNKYYENLAEELPLRTRWVDYKDKEYNPDQIEPGWHAWMSYMTHNPPNAVDGAHSDKIMQPGLRVWEPKEHKPVPTLSWGAYRPYSTTKAKVGSWSPVAKARR
jgi:NADH:ubiquinone oxidoreductase subunit